VFCRQFQGGHNYVFSYDAPYKDAFFSIRIWGTNLTWDTSTHGQISVADKQTFGVQS